jgi:NAD(P)H-dependent FMN reductase
LDVHGVTMERIFVDLHYIFKYHYIYEHCYSDSPLRPPAIAIVSSSLGEASRSRLGARRGEQRLRDWGFPTLWIDLADLPIEAYPRSETDSALQAACAQFNTADGWLIATPVYDFNISGTLLTFLHYALAGDAGERWKPFCLLASMDGLRAAMALDHLGRTLQHERGAVAVGPPLIGIGEQLDVRTGRTSFEMNERMDRSLRALVHYAQARLTLDEWKDPEFPRAGD